MLHLLHNNHVSDHKQAIKSYARAVEIQPEYPAALHNMALSCMDLKMYSQAEKLLLRALKQKNGFHQAHYNLGNLYKETRKYDAALLQFQRAVEIEPQQPMYAHATALQLQDMVHGHMRLFLRISCDFTETLPRIVGTF